MKLSQEAKHGLSGLMVLAKKPPGTVMLLSDIAASQKLPRFLLAKTFQKLTQHGVLRSYRSKIRGYALARPPRDITLKQIVEAIEGPGVFGRCIFWSGSCSENNPCPLHEHWKGISARLMKGLMGVNLAEMVKSAPRRRRASTRTARRVAQGSRR
jgi:Rrf2 family protein